MDLGKKCLASINVNPSSVATNSEARRTSQQMPGGCPFDRLRWRRHRRRRREDPATADAAACPFLKRVKGNDGAKDEGSGRGSPAVAGEGGNGGGLVRRPSSSITTTTARRSRKEGEEEDQPVPANGEDAEAAGAAGRPVGVMTPFAGKEEEEEGPLRLGR